MALTSLSEAYWPIMLIWERINHAYTSDSPPTNWGVQKEDCGFHTWVFNSNNEKYFVVWDRFYSYWRVRTPFGIKLHFIGPLFIDKSCQGLHVPPSFTVIVSDTDVLKPAKCSKVKEQMLKISYFVSKSGII